MNKKNMIEIGIIVAAFGGMAFVLYNGLFKGSGEAVPQVAQTQAIENVLPYGEKLNFAEVFNKQKFRYNLADYPKLDAGNEVGIEVNQLVKPKAQTSAQ